MKKRNFLVCVIICLVIVTGVVASGCSTGFKQDDFSIKLTGVTVSEGVVSVSVVFKNNSMKSGVVTGSFELVYLFYEDENGEPNWGIPSIAEYHFIYAKQNIKKTVQFELPKGKYKVYGIASFNYKKEGFDYKTEIVEIIVE